MIGEVLHPPLPPSRPAHRRAPSFLSRLLRDPAARLSLGFLLLVALGALWAEALAPRDYAAQDLASRFGPPSAAYPLGADQLGRDLLSRLLHGARVSLLVGVVSVGLSLLIGLPLGLAAGYFGGWIDLAAIWLMDLLLAFPSLLLAIAVVAALGPSPTHAMLAIGVVNAPAFGRLVRATVLGLRSAAYVEAARTVGAGSGRVLLVHILPNVLGVAVVRASLGLGTAILVEAGLSFIGLGVQPPDPSWGAMLAEGRAYLRRAPQLTILPGACIMVTVLAFNLLGDALRDALDPRSSR